MCVTQRGQRDMHRAQQCQRALTRRNSRRGPGTLRSSCSCRTGALSIVKCVLEQRWHEEEMWSQLHGCMRSTLRRLLRSAATAEVRVPRALAGVDMRPYQREGLAWLAFLRRSGLHGVLADDMVTALSPAAAAAATNAADDHTEMTMQQRKKGLDPDRNTACARPNLVGWSWWQGLGKTLQATSIMAGKASLPS